MRFLVSTIGSRGEAQPVTALAVQLKELGNEVKVVAPPDFEELVTSNGVDFTPVGPTLRTVAAVKLKPEDLGRLAEESVKEQFRVITQARNWRRSWTAANRRSTSGWAVCEVPRTRRQTPSRRPARSANALSCNAVGRICSSPTTPGTASRSAR
ncbi:glycosyltransferase [Lentzea indica]|uniref:glycosyltransferase n=1 Tax=Lentzea indica TaxID=2604800 RepID=UPI001FE7CC29|nr:glycosyltransferase [Lentzea indica]